MNKRLKIIFVAGEGLLISAVIALAFGLFLEGYGGMMDILRFNWPKFVIITLVIQISLYFRDMYSFSLEQGLVELSARLMESIGLSLFILATLCFFWPELIEGQKTLLAGLIMMVLVSVSWRLLYVVAGRRHVMARRALLVGSGSLAADIWQEINTTWDRGYDVRGVVVPEKEPPAPGQFDRAHVYTGFDDLFELVRAEKADSLIVAFDERRNVLPIEALLDCKLRGIRVIDGESFYEKISGKILVEKIKPSWLIFSEGFIRSKLLRRIKRGIDLLMSAILLVLTAPLLFVVALAIKLETPGPVIFSQERVGEYGRPFSLHKFRSMRKDAEKESGPVWAGEDDPRITRVGKVIRKCRFDELPQLWNVFRGDMSFVGPRPERPFFVDQLKQKIRYYNERFTVKPGVTGWAQIRRGYGASDEDALEKLKYDLFYIKHMSPFMDLLIILQTAKTVLLGRGAR